jgi:hypothetical protein
MTRPAAMAGTAQGLFPAGRDQPGHAGGHRDQVAVGQPLGGGGCVSPTPREQPFMPHTVRCSIGWNGIGRDSMAACPRIRIGRWSGST